MSESRNTGDTTNSSDPSMDSTAGGSVHSDPTAPVSADPTAPVSADPTAATPEQPRQEPFPFAPPSPYGASAPQDVPEAPSPTSPALAAAVPPTAPGTPYPPWQQQSAPPPPTQPGQTTQSYASQPPYAGQPPAYWGQQPGYPPQTYAVARPYGAISGKATAVMVLGISSIVLLCFAGVGLIPGIVALAMAPGAKREIAASGGALTGESQIKTGQITSIITIVLTVLAILALIVLIAAGVWSGTTPSSPGSY